jgi:hypothetical protein
MSNIVPTAQNPFGSSQAPAPTSSVAKSDAERAIQEVQAALVIAKKFPRSPIEAMDRILNACQRPKLAESALYSYPRGGQQVTGPSIRLAEALAQNWGNMQFGIRELSSAGGVSEVEAFAWDVETNTRQTKVFQVPHERHTRQGKKILTDPRDIYEMIANQGARRMRACILGVIPADVIEEAVNQCEATQHANVEVTKDTIKGIADYFEQYGVTQEMIEVRLGRRLDAMQPAQMLDLRKIAQSLKDGMSKPGDWFDVAIPTEAPEAPVSALNKAAPKAKRRPAKDAPAASQEPEPTLAQVQEAIKSHTSSSGLSEYLETMEAFLAIGDNEKYRSELTDTYKHTQDILSEAEADT